MRARNREHVSVAQDVVCEPARTGRIGYAAIEHRLHDLHAPAHHVADDDAIGLWFQLCRIEALVDVDAELSELGTHRRVHVAVAARNRDAGRTRQRGYAAHERSADSQDVYMHSVTQDPAATRL